MTEDSWDYDIIWWDTVWGRNLKTEHETKKKVPRWNQTNQFKERSPPSCITLTHLPQSPVHFKDKPPPGQCSLKLEVQLWCHEMRCREHPEPTLSSKLSSWKPGRVFSHRNTDSSPEWNISVHLQASGISTSTWANALSKARINNLWDILKLWIGLQR